MSPITYFKEVGQELKKVIWPRRKDVLHSTMVVILFTAAVTAFLGGLNLAFAEILKMMVPK